MRPARVPLASRPLLALAVALGVAAGGAGCGGCDVGSLEALQSELALAPGDVSAVAWIGHDNAVPFTVENRGRAFLDVSAASVDGAAALGPEGVVDVVVERARLAPGESGRVDVMISAQRGVAAVGPVELLLRVVTVDRQVATASLHVDVREPPECTPRDPCETVAFDVVSGLCVRTARPDGEQCDDASACTDDDRCSAGRCVGLAVECVDSVACTVDACDPAVGCVFTPIHERCDDGNACSDDICDPASAPLGGEGCRSVTSEDGTPCGPISCAQLSLCMFGVCVDAPTPDGFPCEDGDLCTQGDACAAQECVPGAPVAPSAAPPVALARPAVHVEPDVRWRRAEVFDDGPPPLPVDVTPGFDSVLDVAQGVVGFRPTLAVLWRSQAFDVDGNHCAPWDMWSEAALAAAVPDAVAFCASAVVVTFVDEAELAAAGAFGNGGAAAGSSVVLDVVYGTAAAAFAPRVNVVDDELRVVIAESTYWPSPDPGRELHVERVTLSLAARAVVERTREVHYSGPRWQVTSNVHAGLRVALGLRPLDVEPVGEPPVVVDEAFVGWDLPQDDVISDLQPGDTDGAGDGDADGDPGGGGGDPGQVEGEPHDPDGEGAGDSAELVEEVPPVFARLDVAAVASPGAPGEYGQVAWNTTLEDMCMSVPYAVEEVAWRDVDAARVGGRTYVVVRHDALPSDAGDALAGCGEIVTPTLVSGLIVDVDGHLSRLSFPDALAVALADDAGALASVSYADVVCAAVEGEPCPTVIDLTVQPAPFDQLDPVVTRRRAQLALLDVQVPRVASLAVDAGSYGAVVAHRGIYDGMLRVALVDELALDDGGAAPASAGLTLTTEPFRAPDAPLRALRSPLAPQRVYAVTTADGGDDVGGVTEGVVVRFGCGFPTLP